MPTVSVNGVDLFYEDTGRGEPLLGVHGTPSSSRLWVDAARELSRHCRAIVYDRRGFGASGPWPRPDRLDLADHVADAAGLLAALDAAPATVVGRSTGGLIALALAFEHPEAVRRLVLLEPAVLSLDPDSRAWAARLRRRVLSASAADAGRASEAVIVGALGPAAWSDLPEVARETMVDAAPAVLAEVRGTGLDLSADAIRPALSWVPEVRCPVLLVSAEDSPPVLHRVNVHLLELLPHAELVDAPGGHLIHPAHPAVLEFLGRTSTTP